MVVVGQEGLEHRGHHLGVADVQDYPGGHGISGRWGFGRGDRAVVGGFVEIHVRSVPVSRGSD